ncbi:hypothetical protein C8R44DRAFT_858891 [Mycena epipterygia]|nr:hypothetical protein C8R44DRAFT_858891 [Mycena epipterygia]
MRLLGSNVVSKRCLLSRTGVRLHGRLPPLPPEFVELMDVPPLDPSTPVPLDAIVDRLAPPPRPSRRVSWPAPPPRKDLKSLARQIRAHIAARDISAAIAVLRDAPHPHPRLLVHAAVHALLRVQETKRAGALLLAFATTRITPKLPRVHSTTLAQTITALLKLIPNSQGPHEWGRTKPRPNLLYFSAQLVSNPALRTALALYIEARKLFVCRQKAVTAALWTKLLEQREWIPAALMVDLQVKDYQLRKTLPTILRDQDPEATPLTPHDRDHLRRRLAVLRMENIRASRALFADLCHRVGGVISNLASRPESGFMSPAITIAKQRATAARQAAVFYADRPVPSTRFTDTDPDGHYADLDADAYRYPSGFGNHPAKKALTRARAIQHARVALQALTILGTLVHARQIPFADIRPWVLAVGSIPSTLASFSAYSAHTGRPIRVAARAHLRTVLETYAAALPRTPHVYSEFDFKTAGSIRRGLKHTILNDVQRTSLAPDPALRTAGAPPTALEGFLGQVELDGFSSRDRKKARKAAQFRQQDSLSAVPDPRVVKSVAVAPKTRHSPPDDPVEAEDDSLSPPPSMPTCEALLYVFLAPRAGVGALYEPAPGATLDGAAAADEDDEAAADEDARPDGDADAEMETRVQQHYHAPRSPNNPHPYIQYPSHPLDFDAYPAAPPPPESLPATPEVDELTRYRVRLAARVLAHMLRERSPPLPPWQSHMVMRLVAQHAELLRPELTESGLWDELWAGMARARRDAEVRASEARRLVDPERQAYDQRYDGDREEEPWAVESAFLRDDGAGQVDSENAELRAFDRRLGKGTRDKDLETYYSTVE